MRTARIASESGSYHVTVRGNGRQLIFEDDTDRQFFIELLSGTREQFSIRYLAWCLMGNHVHLVVQADREDLSKAMAHVLSRYAAYFNNRTGHVGHVFQNRFDSVPIEQDSHLLEAVRYVHRNPDDIGAGAWKRYRWSSYREYLGSGWGLTDISLVLGMIGSVESFVEFTSARMPSKLPYVQRRLNDEDAFNLACQITGEQEPQVIKSFPKARRNALIAQLRHEGLSVRQIERLTGIGRSTISRVA